MNDQKIKSLKQTLEEDPKLAYSSNEERELRLKYPFSNVFIDFPTTGYSVSFPAYMKGLQVVLILLSMRLMSSVVLTQSQFINLQKDQLTLL